VPHPPVPAYPRRAREGNADEYQGDSSDDERADVLAEDEDSGDDRNDGQQVVDGRCSGRAVTVALGKLTGAAKADLA
jgi:hypothetical protein